MVSFDAVHRAVHYPEDRRFRIWVRPSILIGIAIVVLAVFAAAWIEFAVVGLPAIPQVPQSSPNNFAGPHGFPLWVRYCHFFNFFFVMMLIRSGLSILMDHPRLYFNDDCTPGSEWIRFTPIDSPSRPHLDCQRRLPLYLAYRRDTGLQTYHRNRPRLALHQCPRLHCYRHLSSLSCSSTQSSGGGSYRLRRSSCCKAGTSSYITQRSVCRLSRTASTDTTRCSRSRISAVFFVFGPMAILTGIAMSPAVVNHFPWYARIFGGRQAARSIHFLTMLSFFAFIVVHVTLVVMTGFARNMNHIVMGTDDQSNGGMIWGFVGIGAGCPLVVRSALPVMEPPTRFATRPQVRHIPDATPHLESTGPASGLYSEAQISPYFWPNGKMPVRDDWKQHGTRPLSGFPFEGRRTCRESG